MKKYIAVCTALLLFCGLSITAYAKDEPVTVTSSDATSTTASVSGTTNALAVAIQVRDADNNIVAMATAGTSGGAFNVSVQGLNLQAGKTYTVFVADYEGGDFAKTNVTVPENDDDNGGGGGSNNSSNATVVTAVPAPTPVPAQTETPQPVPDPDPEPELDDVPQTGEADQITAYPMTDIANADQTGNSPAALFVAAAAISGFGIVVLLRRREK